MRYPRVSIYLLSPSADATPAHYRHQASFIVRKQECYHCQHIHCLVLFFCHSVLGPSGLIMFLSICIATCPALVPFVPCPWTTLRALDISRYPPELTANLSGDHHPHVSFIFIANSLVQRSQILLYLLFCSAQPSSWTSASSVSAKSIAWLRFVRNFCCLIITGSPWAVTDNGYHRLREASS